jgi:Uma2 family endonuclease
VTEAIADFIAFPLSLYLLFNMIGARRARDEPSRATIPALRENEAALPDQTIPGSKTRSAATPNIIGRLTLPNVWRRTGAQSLPTAAAHLRLFPRKGSPMGAIFDCLQAPTRHRFDVDAYYKLAEAGVLENPKRVELIDGEIIDLNSIGSPHAAITNRLARDFIRAIGNMAFVSVQSPLRLDSYNEPEPDLLLLRPRADDYRKSHPGAADVLLLVEVSDSSLAYDRGPKLALYANFGVPEVWVVDIAGSAVEIFRQPKDGAYSLTERRTGASLTPELVPDVAIDVAALLA